MPLPRPDVAAASSIVWPGAAHVTGRARGAARARTAPAQAYGQIDESATAACASLDPPLTPACHSTLTAASAPAAAAAPPPRARQAAAGPRAQHPHPKPRPPRPCRPRRCAGHVAAQAHHQGAPPPRRAVRVPARGSGPPARSTHPDPPLARRRRSASSPTRRLASSPNRTRTICATLTLSSTGPARAPLRVSGEVAGASSSSTPRPALAPC